MGQQINQITTWHDVVQRYTSIKVLRPESVKNYKRYVEIFSRFFGDDFDDINTITTQKVTLFRSFF
ncbi:hypothetical protein [Orbus mooreae]|uniref:hypothetical protein n=1 Tax=Orbus mooreae TaxID=3074107 RepID=UPI00370DD9A7